MIPKPTARELAQRDPAAAALLGILPGSAADFGGEFGDDDYGFGFGFGADPMPAAAHPAMVHPSHPAHPAHPGNQARMMALWQQHHAKMAHTKTRERLIDPNADSEIKIERYDFTLNQAITLGSPLAGFISTLQPSVKIRPQRLVVNAPAPGFVLLTSIQVANVNVLVGAATDGFSYSAQAQGSHLDLPTLEPANRATVQGTYSGLTPPGFVPATPYTLTFTFQGPATIVA